MTWRGCTSVDPSFLHPPSYIDVRVGHLASPTLPRQSSIVIDGGQVNQCLICKTQDMNGDNTLTTAGAKRPLTKANSCTAHDVCILTSASEGPSQAPLTAQSSPSTPRRPHSIHAQRRIPRVVGSIPIGERPSPTEIQAQPRSMLQIHGGVVPMAQRGVVSDMSSLLSVLCRFLCKAFPYLGWRERLRV